MQSAFECQQCRALCAVFVERWQHQHVHDAAPQRVELWQDELPQASPVRVPAVAGIEQQRARMRDDQRGRTTSGVEDARRVQCPARDWRAGTNSSGSATQTADSRSVHGQRLKSTTPDNAAKAIHHGDGVARHNASSRSAAHTSPGQAKS